MLRLRRGITTSCPGCTCSTPLNSPIHHALLASPRYFCASEARFSPRWTTTIAKSRSWPSTSVSRGGGGASSAGGAGGGAAQPAITSAAVNSRAGEDRPPTDRGRGFMALLQGCRGLVERRVQFAEFVLAGIGNSIVVTSFGQFAQRVGQHPDRRRQSPGEEIDADGAGGARYQRQDPQHHKHKV